MLGRSALAPKVLEELGYMTVVYSGIEEHLTIFASAFMDINDPRLHYTTLASKKLTEKLNKLAGETKSRCTELRINYEQFELEQALEKVRGAAERRNEVVHGFAQKANEGYMFSSNRVHKPTTPHLLTQHHLANTNEALLAADGQLTNAAISIWNAVQGAVNAAKKPSLS